MRCVKVLMRCLLVGVVAGVFAAAALETAPPSGPEHVLPRVLVIGDSISMGYITPLRDLLKGRAVVQRNKGNARDTGKGLQYLDEWLGDTKWDVIQFNFGLHDLKGFTVDGVTNHKTPPDTYDKQLRLIVERLKKTGARLVWASTTPVPAGCTKQGKIYRREGDAARYNAIAKPIMDETGIPITDLYAVVMSRREELQRPANVHFTARSSAILAERVARGILVALGEQQDE